VLITGGYSGIGFEVAKRISLYHKVYIGIHRDDELKYARERIKDYKNIKVIKLDVTDEKDLKKIKRYNFDIVVLNASVGIGGSVLDIPIERIKECYEVNVFGTINIIKSVIKNMVDNDYGRIVVISSLIGVIPFKFMGIYGSTKASLINLSIALKKELKLISKNIKISLIEPGAYKTGFNDVMLENKYKYLSKSIYFKDKESKIRKNESKLFRFIEQHNLKSIASKIEDAIMSDKPKFIYRAPFIQGLFKKIEILLFY
jgi:short-subunit dehydrogenase